MVMQDALGAIELVLPLTIAHANWVNQHLTIGGNGWNFSTRAAWRLIKDGVIRPLDDTNEGERADLVQGLVGEVVVSVEYQSTSTPIDPRFVFRSGNKLEIFSVDGWEPWVLRTPGHVFVSSPSDHAEIALPSNDD